MASAERFPPQLLDTLARVYACAAVEAYVAQIDELRQSEKEDSESKTDAPPHP